MYGISPYGKNPFAGITDSNVLLVPATKIGITVGINQPVVFTTEVVGFLSITATVIPPTVTLTPKEITILVNSVDISDQVSFNSLQISNNIYSEPTMASFSITKSDNKSYVPTAGDEIEIYDTGVKIFAGLLIRKDERTNGLLETYKLQFKDWTEELSTYLVDQTYTNYTVNDIIADIFTDLTDYDLTNVSDTTVISQLVSDNISITKALDKLAELSGKYWFVSPDKEIYFFEASTVSAPFDLTDENGKYYYSSLEVGEDLTQIRNKVTIKGKGVSAVTVEDATSQTTYGVREYYEMDNNVRATNEATQKANAILATYKDSIKTATFETKEFGLFAGQQIDIDSTIRGVNETLTIESVKFQSNSQNRFRYIVKATTERLGRLEDLFQTEQEDTTTPTGDQNYLQDISFTAIDNETIQWSSGSITTSTGTVYSINAKASQGLTASHVIYLDPDVSTTELQISTTFSDGIGGDKIPLCYAIRNAVSTKGADIFPVSFGGKIQIDGGTHITDNSIITDNIASNAITANEISANAVTATKINVSTLSAISANVGTITAGTITGVTITGATVQTATTGYRVRMTSASTLQFLNGATVKGSIRADTGDTMVLATYTSGNFQFFAGTSSLGVWNTSGLTLPSGKTLAFSGGSQITDAGSELQIDRQTRFDGNIYPKDDNTYSSGASNKRWGTVFAEDMRCDDLLVNVSFSGCGSISGCAYNEVNLMTDEQVAEYKADVGKKGKKKDKEKNYTGFAMGDVLCWGGNGLKRSQFDTAHCVVAVADKRGMPTVLGAEKIKVIGKVARNSFLVTSPQEGFARAWTDKKNDPPRGTVIAMALQDKTDDSPSLIKAMIQKI